MSLTDFLLARIAEDEEAAAIACAHPAEVTGGRWAAGPRRDQADRYWFDAVIHRDPEPSNAPLVGKVLDAGFAEHIARHDPARVLAECEAKRRIVGMGGNSCGGADEEFYEDFEKQFGFPATRHYPGGFAQDCEGCAAACAGDRDHEHVIRVLASVYADHPDFRDEWKP